MVVLKVLIFNSSTWGGCCGLARTAFLTVSNFGGCGGLARTAFLTV